MNWLRYRGRKDKGNAAVEFALALPIFAVLLFGIMEFSWYFFVQHTMQYATREGMRLALVGRTLTVGGTPLTRADSIVKTIRDNAAIAVNPAQVSVSIYPIVETCVGSNCTYADDPNWQNLLNAGSAGDYMRVRSRYVHRLFTPLIGTFFTGGTITIQAEGTYRNELFN
jgi:Flp pilus assembly protein TadG